MSCKWCSFDIVPHNKLIYTEKQKKKSVKITKTQVFLKLIKNVFPCRELNLGYYTKGNLILPRAPVTRY